MILRGFAPRNPKNTLQHLKAYIFIHIFDRDPNTQKTQIDALKKRVDENKKYHDQYKKNKTKSDGHTDAVKDLSG